MKTNAFVPRAPGERYLGTAARPTSTSRLVLKRKPITQQKARDNNTNKVDALASLKKTNTVLKPPPKQANAPNLESSSSVKRKMSAEDGMSERATKKQRLTALPPPSFTQTQRIKTGKVSPSARIPVKAALTTRFFDSLYSKDSKIRASVGVSSSYPAWYQ